MDTIILFLGKLIALIPGPSGALLVVLMFMSELVMRLWPTAKPKSWLLFVSDVLHKVSALIVKLGELLSKLSTLLDGFIQNIKG